MWKTAEDQERGIRWTLSLEDLDFADYLALPSHTHHHLQEEENSDSSPVGNKFHQAFCVYQNCENNRTGNPH